VEDGLTSAVDDLTESFAGGELSGAFEEGIVTMFGLSCKRMWWCRSPDSGSCKERQLDEYFPLRLERDATSFIL
jgi:hypothetical protein